MAEVLTFARRWEADLQGQRAERKDATTLALFSYLLMIVKMNNLDVRELRLWPDDYGICLSLVNCHTNSSRRIEGDGSHRSSRQFQRSGYGYPDTLRLLFVN